jgi:hypothetical protein
VAVPTGSQWGAFIAIALLSACATRLVEVPLEAEAKTARDAVTLS